MPNFYFIKKIIAIGLATLMAIGITSVYASASSGIMPPGNAAVTGFSGTINQENDNTLFDNNGPSVRIITLPESGTFGLRDTLKPFIVTASDVGQVFGIALDDAPQPSIFVAATSAYGLAIYRPGVGRLKHGTPGAQFMPGQFGPAAQGGGSGSIWRIDGISGKVSLFANVTYNGIENTPASLGGLAFDPTTRQLFVVNRATGMIHRFSLDGTDNGVFDHGLQGLSAAGQQQVPFDPSTLAKISSPSFDAENPETWGFAPTPRRVFALAVHGQRLFYSVFGSQIWSVGIASDGSFVDDARFEVDSPALQQGVEISSIAFDALGLMYIAERGAPTGDYNFINVANSGQNRVKRFVPKIPSESSPSFWAAPGDEYAIGMSPEYQNADGGVALTCGRTIWTTGDHLLDTGSAESFPFIDGLQGNDKDLVKPKNVPPEQSWYVNYYNNQADPNSRGHMGAIVTRTVCGGYIVPPVPVGFKCPAGTFLVDGACLIPPSCPSGTIFLDGYCIYPNCPWGFVRIDNICVRPPHLCDYGTVFINGYCIPVGCPPGLEWATYGYCRCPNYSYFHDGRCMPPPPCPPHQRYRDGRCVPPSPCPPNQRYIDGRCVPPSPCPPNQRYRDGRCVPPSTCPPNQRYIDGRCVPPSPCPPNQKYRDGRCVPPSTCPPNQRYIDGRCVPPSPCPPNQKYRDGRCVPPSTCPPNQKYIDGRCVPPSPCPPNQKYRDGRCVPPSPCPPNQKYRDGRCVPPSPCPSNQRYIDGRCVPPTTCPPNQRVMNGKCVPTNACKSNQRLVNGECITHITCKNHQQLVNGRCVTQQNCNAGEVMRKGRCVSTQNGPHCPSGQSMKNGHCTTNPPSKPTCPAGQYYRDGHCISTKGTRNSNQNWKPSYQSTSPQMPSYHQQQKYQQQKYQQQKYQQQKYQQQKYQQQKYQQQKYQQQNHQLQNQQQNHQLQNQQQNHKQQNYQQQNYQQKNY